MSGATHEFPRRRRGTTLAESMIASVLLATSVVGISGALSASYQNQAFADARRAAGTAGRKLMENVVALPMDPATAGAPSLADYQYASATPATTVASSSPLGVLLGSLTFNLVRFPTASVSTTTTSSTTPSTAAVSVDRRASLAGAASTTGDFAIVTVAVPTQTSTSSSSTVRFKRLVTSVEAAANRAN